MIKIKNFIAQIRNKKNLKWVLMFLILGGLFVGKTYAVNGESGLDTISWLLNLILSLASWVWILLANLAGKLMTNDLVYGSFLHLDVSLWNLRNIMKNFANFALGFMVLFAIVRNIFSGPFGKASDDWSPINIIKKTLIAGVLIQMSWFFMGAVIDLSTIMTSAIGAFPSQFITSNNEFQGDIKNNLRSLEKGKITFNPDDTDAIVKWEADEDGSLANADDNEINRLLDTLMPNYDSVSGPLIFIGLSVFNFNEFENYSSGGGNEETGVDERGDLFLSLGISAIILIAFSLMMFLIFLFNLFRIIMLWIIIPLLPIIILLKVFKLTDKLKGGGSGLDLSKFMSIKNILVLVFKPVLMVGTLSLILVILVLIKNVIAGNKVDTIPLTNQGNVVIETVQADGDGELYNSSIKSEGIMEFSMNGVKDTIADIIVYLFGLFLIYFLVKMVVKMETGIGFIDKSLTGIFATLEKLATNLPIIPIPGIGGVGISSLGKEADFGKAATRLAGINVDEQNKNILSALGLSNTFDYIRAGSGVPKSEFITNAVSIGKSRDLEWRSFWSDQSLQNKISEWNTSNKGDIQQKEIKAAWDNPGKTSDEGGAEAGE